MVKRLVFSELSIHTTQRLGIFRQPSHHQATVGSAFGPWPFLTQCKNRLIYRDDRTHFMVCFCSLANNSNDVHHQPFSVQFQFVAINGHTHFFQCLFSHIFISTAESFVFYFSFPRSTLSFSFSSLTLLRHYSTIDDALFFPDSDTCSVMGLIALKHTLRLVAFHMSYIPLADSSIAQSPCFIPLSEHLAVHVDPMHDFSEEIHLPYEFLAVWSHHLELCCFSYPYLLCFV